MVPLIEIFDVWYGVNLEVVNSEVVPVGIPFVSRQSVNNGIVCYVKKIDDVEPNPAHTLSIAVSGSVLSTFYHDYEYYSGRDVYVAKPKFDLSKEQMLYYCYVIEQNKYRYNYGRGANKTFRDILVPSVNEIPSYVDQMKIGEEFCSSAVLPRNIQLHSEKWKWFRYERKMLSWTKNKTGDEPNASLSEKIFEPNCITVSNNGSVGYAFYQPKEFTCTHDVNPLYIHKKWNKELNIYIAMFLCSLIEKERFRWDYGRKWRPKRMPDSLIKLPAVKKADGKYEPDWQFMEDYIKSLPYSSCL